MLRLIERRQRMDMYTAYGGMVSGSELRWCAWGAGI
jgi:hypothetical protein